MKDSGDQLFASLYEELRRMAQQQLRRGGPALTLGATTLLHEAYLNLQARGRMRSEEAQGPVGGIW